VGGITKQRDLAFNELFNKAVSSVRQPIESLFNWINELTQIQNASKVRSENGLKLHLYGKITVALMILTNFYPLIRINYIKKVFTQPFPQTIA